MFPSLRVVWFDCGFTLWNEQRVWTTWAEWLGVPALEFFAVLSSVIERGEHHHRVFEIFRPEIDLEPIALVGSLRDSISDMRLEKPMTRRAVR